MLPFRGAVGVAVLPALVVASDWLLPFEFVRADAMPTGSCSNSALVENAHMDVVFPCYRLMRG